jgi:hypothetical protein
VLYDKCTSNKDIIMRAGAFFVILSALALPGCVSFNTPMKNARGEVAACQNTGWGWLGAPIATINQKRCESDLRERGFVTLAETPPNVQAPPTPGFTPQAVSTPPTAPIPEVKSQAKISIKLPAGWQPVALTENQVKSGIAMQASNPQSESFMVLSARSKAKLTDLREFALSIQADQAARVSNPEPSVLSKIELAGNPAYMLHVIGQPNGAPQPMRFNILVVEGASEVAVLNVWLPESIYGAHKKQVDALTAALTGLDS